MPLRAVSNSGNLQAFEYDAQSWAELKGDYRRLNLTLPCCGIAAIPKTSALGNFFFAHARKDECITAPESAEHLYCKNLIAQAAQSADWVVTTERRGVSPVGEDWIADVFCEKGNAMIAFEVQMAPQTIEETVRRQLRYKASGVRAAWLLGRKASLIADGCNKDLPAFTLGLVEVGKVPTVERFRVDLTAFVIGMLNRQLRWTVPLISRPLYIEYLKDICWKCQRPVKQVYGLLKNLEDAEKWGWHERPFSVLSVNWDIYEVTLKVGNLELMSKGLNPLTERKHVKGKPAGLGFCNLCMHCHAPQDGYQLAKKLCEAIHGLRQNPNEPDYEIHEDPGLDPSVGLVPIERTVEGAGEWEFVIT
jgi:hypothetical protein